VRIYLDAVPIIYVVEQVLPYSETLYRRFTNDGTMLIVSDRSRLECRIKPLRNNDMGLLADYDQFFQNVIQETVVLSSDVMDRATEIRATYGFRTPDAIHLAAAVYAGCDLFLTNDLRLKRFANIEIQTV
jgi:predicted nucleic acid-binding protein